MFMEHKAESRVNFFPLLLFRQNPDIILFNLFMELSHVHIHSYFYSIGHKTGCEILCCISCIRRLSKA